MKPSGGGGGETSGESLTLCSNSVKNVVSQAKQSKAAANEHVAASLPVP